MKRLVFDELLILSRKERSARRVVLDPRSTVIKGANDTGKSSIIKSLYWTLGAEPRFHQKWKGANVYTSLRFSIDGLGFRMIRVGRRFSLFDSRDCLIGTYTNVTSGLGPKIAELFDFRLLLRSKSNETDEQATPAFLFLPFYLDQDSGWTNKLTSFGNLQQFRNPNKDVIFYHFGIRPSAYYMAKSRKSEAESKVLPLRQERDFLQAFLERIQIRLKFATFHADPDVFKEEVEILLAKGSELQKKEESQKNRMAETYAVVSSIEDQIEITRGTLRELRADQAYAASDLPESVECPICHAEYENGFAERFSIAVDEDRCHGLLQELDEELGQARRKYKDAAEATESVRSLSSELQALLKTERQKLKLADLVKSESRRETRQVVEEQISELEARIGSLDTDREKAIAEMKSFEDRKHREAILDSWRAVLGDLVEALDVPTLPESFYKNPASPSKETGSDQPRALLAFYLSAVHTINTCSTSTMCPLVIDSPNQQDQDEASYAKIRTVINEKRPMDSQLILAVADDEGTDFGGSVIELYRKLSVLSKEEFDDVRDELIPLYEMALEAGSDE